jgi:hypothetical protein
MIYINQNFSEQLPISFTNTTYIEFTVEMFSNTSIVVYWGDNTSTTYSGTAILITHTYSTPFTGNIKLSCSSGKHLFKGFNNFTNTLPINSASFTTIQLGNFTSLQNLSVEYGSISGDIANLPPNLITYQNQGNNTTSGDIANLPPNLITYQNQGNNTTSGDIANLHEGLLVYSNGGANTTTGDIANLPLSLTNYTNNGANTTTGDIANLPLSLTTYNNDGANTTTGDIANLPLSLTNYGNQGNNTTTGDIANLPLSLTTYSNNGANTTTGDIANLPLSLTTYSNDGANTTTGDIANLPLSLVWFKTSGANTTTGDIANLPINIEIYDNRGFNTVNNYTIGRTWKSPMLWVINYPTLASGGLSSVEVDNLLVDLANVDLWENIKVVDLSGNNQPRTASSDTAVTTLISKGVTVTTN